MGFYESVFRRTLYPLILMIVTPNMAVVIPYIIVEKNSNLRLLWIHDGFWQTITDAWASVKWDLIECPLIIIAILIWGAISIVAFGGEPFLGPKTESGFRPQYQKSGFRFYVISMTIMVAVIAYFPMLPLYYNFVTFSAYLVVFGFIFAMYLFYKGRNSPSPGVFGSSRNIIFDFYWGTELYPRIGEDLDLKQLINCRFGLFLWQLIILGAWKANYELYQSAYERGDFNWAFTANVLLQTFYLAKFYYSEDAYFSTIDICVDRFGYYIAWGCIAWVPTFYTSSSLYMVRHSPIAGFNFLKFIVTVSCGIAMVAMNYITDYQRQLARETNGKCELWGRPARIIHAVYQSEDGKPVRTILLASGFWGMARHINYAFELGAAFVWSATASFFSPIPYFYVIFLYFLLIHRSFRDDHRCKEKYGKYWNQYREMVPFRILPYVF